MKEQGEDDDDYICVMFIQSNVKVNTIMKILLKVLQWKESTTTGVTETTGLMATVYLPQQTIADGKQVDVIIRNVSFVKVVNKTIRIFICILNRNILNSIILNFIDYNLVKRHGLINVKIIMC